MRSFIKALAVTLPALAACSSDAAPLPEPGIRQAGSFIAVGEGEMTLLRTLKSIALESDMLIFATVYDVVPATYEQARELAQKSQLPIRVPLEFESENVLKSHPHRVVWFRTLTKAEEDLSL